MDEKKSTQQNPLPSITLPKGGGSLQGSGEKFTANPSTGTGSMNIPIGTSPGRGGFGPSLSLDYDSANGNGPFGMGWQLSLPAITRKTSRGIPRYCDLEESDIFLMSGAEDLVPMLNADGSRFIDSSLLPGYTIHRYRPRIEGAFTRIDRCSSTSVPEDVHWRIMSTNNVLSIYGNSDESRISNPVDKSQIFSWLLAETRDSKGNAIIYSYTKENGVGVDLSQQHQRNRGDKDDLRRTSNRYLTSVQYGNIQPLLDTDGNRPHLLTAEQRKNAKWLFELRLDYGDKKTTLPPDESDWTYREDSFSTYRPGFEIRTTRLCQRFMMFHHFELEPDVGENCLVSCTELEYTPNGVYTFLNKVTRAGFKRKDANSADYVRLDQPPVEFEYSRAEVQQDIVELDSGSLQNLPAGLATPYTRWIDLYGEGLPSVLLQSPGAWYLKRNLSPIAPSLNPNLVSPAALLAPLECLQYIPNTNLTGTAELAELLDLRGDGRTLNFLDFDRPLGSHATDGKEGWQDFLALQSSMNKSLRDMSVRYLDIDGDGIVDALVADESVTVCYPLLDRGGFGPPLPISTTVDEEFGPRQLFWSTDELIYLSDMSGDGLQDVVRIRNGEICYWPNQGYGSFGAKITMDNSPIFDHDEHFHYKRVILGDIDGTGTTDIIYLHGEGVRLYVNQCGNGWSEAHVLPVFASPTIDKEFSTVDILGNGTLCLVMSSSLPSSAPSVQYINLVGTTKPFLLTGFRNNMGASTSIQYASSTKFYLQDKLDSKPWISHLPMPVHVVETLTTFDYIGKSISSTRYAYHHGCFDIIEREFRGFGMVEQWDFENIASVTTENSSEWANQAPEHHLPPVHTRSWFHTGILIDGNSITTQYQHEYYMSGLTPSDPSRQTLLPDSKTPSGLSYDEICEAVRALKGALLRQEVYSDDAPDGFSDSAIAKSKVPYAITEASFNVFQLQGRGSNKFGVFQTLLRESVGYQLERNTADPRIGHSLALEYDKFGNPLKTLSITYGRLSKDPELPTDWDRDMQSKTVVTYTENQMTNEIDDMAKYPYSYRLPVDWESKSFELTGFGLDATEGLSKIEFWIDNGFSKLDSAPEIGFEEVPDLSKAQKRLLSLSRTLFRKDDLSRILPCGQLDSLGLKGETYTLALTDSILARYMKRNNAPLLPNFTSMLTSTSPGGGGYISSNKLKSDGLFPSNDSDGQYWIPSGRSFFANEDDVGKELQAARQGFFTAVRHRNPFGAQGRVVYDDYNLVTVDAYDFVGNRISVGDRNASGTIVRKGVDYRILHPRIMTDVNGNRSEVAFDALGRVVGHAIRGKSEENLGDSFDKFDEDMDPAAVVAHMANPFDKANEILGTATARYMYDPFAYMRTRNSNTPQPCAAYDLHRVTHESDLANGQQSEMLHSFGYSDGFGRTIQCKSLTSAGPVPQRNAQGHILLGENNQPILTDHDVNPRWITSGWVIYNNKGSPVRQFEPFFSDLSTFEFSTKVGVSSVIFYDAPGRVMCTLLPDGAYTKANFDPWRTESWDSDDTVQDDPRTDPDIQSYVQPYFSSLVGEFKTWYAQRIGGSLGLEEKDAAEKSAAHAHTPDITYLDSQGRSFLNMEQSKITCPGHPMDGSNVTMYSRSEMDCAGKVTVAHDSLISTKNPQGRVVAKVAYDMAGNPVYKNGLENGETWILTSINGSTIHVWNNVGQLIRSEFDSANRPLRTLLTPPNGTTEIEITRLVYGDNHWEASQRNLRGEVYAMFDQSGVGRTERIDFQGRALLKTPRVCSEYRESIDWTPLEKVLPAQQNGVIDPQAFSSAIESFLLPETFSSEISHDALGRTLTLTTPHSEDMKTNTFRLKYDVMNLIGLDGNLRAETTSNNDLVWTSFIKDVKLNAKGQKLLTKYGNDVVSTNEYDFVNQLRARYTRRDTTKLDNDLQSLHFTYDSMRNITTIRDDSQQTNYFRGQVTTPTNTYVYDSTYRLIQAIGREHVGQAGSVPTPYSASDSDRFGPQPGQAEAMAGYTEQYVYDNSMNMTQMKHIGLNSGWTREFAYEERSKIVGEDDISNKLSHSTVGRFTENYLYDELGNTIHVPHLSGTNSDSNMHWDFIGQLQQLDLGGGGTAYYTYNSAGQRVRKVIERLGGQVEDRLYLGEVEVYRKKLANEIVLERETLHVYDDNSRVALVETRTKDTKETDPAPSRLIRFQHTSHLGSSVIELDQNAQIISFEEYSPYGTSTYQATTANLETPKRYRFTGKERDEESDFEYHESRYYAPWLGRWMSCDPGGSSADGLNLYCYTGCNPIRLKDPSGREGQNDDITFSAPKKGIQPSYLKSPDPAHKVTIQENNAPGADAYDTTKTDPGIPVPEKWRFARAKNPFNKVFMIGPENNALGNSMEIFTDARISRSSFEPVSLKTRPDLLFSRTFGELTEMAIITEQAIEEIKLEGGPPSSPTAYKDAINGKIWYIIRNSASEVAAIVREAFAFNRAPIAQGGRPTLDPGPERPNGNEPSNPDYKGPRPRRRGGGGGGAGGGTSKPSTNPSEATAPSPESTPSTSAPTEPVVEGPVPVTTGSTGSGTSFVQGAKIGISGIMNASAVGTAAAQFDSGDIAGGAKTLSITAGLAFASKIPGVGVLILPISMNVIPRYYPSVLDHADDVYWRMTFQRHRRSEFSRRAVWAAVALHDVAKNIIWDSTISGLKAGARVTWKYIRIKEAY
jgi:RHS repeat-associated protein